MNADLHMAGDLKNTRNAQSLRHLRRAGHRHPRCLRRRRRRDRACQGAGERRRRLPPQHWRGAAATGPDGIACWFIDTDYNQESFFVRHAYFLGQNDPYKALKTTLKAEINQEAWETLHSDTSRPFDKPESGRIAVKVINHLGDEVMKVFRVD